MMDDEGRGRHQGAMYDIIATDNFDRSLGTPETKVWAYFITGTDLPRLALELDEIHQAAYRIADKLGPEVIFVFPLLPYVRKIAIEVDLVSKGTFLEKHLSKAPGFLICNASLNKITSSTSVYFIPVDVDDAPSVTRSMAEIERCVTAYLIFFRNQHDPPSVNRRQGLWGNLAQSVEFRFDVGPAKIDVSKLCKALFMGRQFQDRE